MFHITGHGGKQQSCYNSVQVLPLSGSTICCQGMSVKWILLWLKNKGKAYMYHMPQTWKTEPHGGGVCVWLYPKTVSLCPLYGHREEYSHITSRVLLIFFRIWVIFPWHSFGSEWFVELSRVAVVPADLKTLQSEQRTPVFTRIWRFGAHGSGFFHYSCLSFWLITEAGSELRWHMPLLCSRCLGSCILLQEVMSVSAETDLYKL